MPMVADLERGLLGSGDTGTRVRALAERLDISEEAQHFAAAMEKASCAPWILIFLWRSALQLDPCHDACNLILATHLVL